MCHSLFVVSELFDVIGLILTKFLVQLKDWVFFFFFFGCMVFFWFLNLYDIKIGLGFY